MKKELKKVIDFHNKFNALINSTPQLIDSQRSNLRYKLMKEEVEEYIKWVQKWDIENITKELCDILYTVYWTIVEHWLQDKIEDCFDEVHKSNMSKTYDIWKMKKWDDYKEADIKKVLKK